MTKHESPAEVGEAPPPDHAGGRIGAGFLAGLVFGAFLGAGVALVFAPDRGANTRSRLRRRMRELQTDALEGLDQAGTRTRKELSRRKRRLRADLERLRQRAREKAREARESLD